MAFLPKTLERRSFMQDNKPPTKRSFSSRLKESIFNNTLGGYFLPIVILLIAIILLVCIFTNYSPIAKIILIVLVYSGILACVFLCANLVSKYTHKDSK